MTEHEQDEATLKRFMEIRFTKVQFRYGAGAWQDCNDNLFHFSGPEKYYRIKPPEVQVPWQMADVPWPWPVVRNLNTAMDDKIYKITSMGSVGVDTDFESIDWGELLSNYEHSTDGINWRPCSKLGGAE